MRVAPLCLLAPLLAAPCAFADDASMDADANGFVTAQEHAASAAGMFKAMDGDGDGRVTAAEMTAAKAPAAGELTAAEKIAVIDTDKDGVLTAKEHADGSAGMFATMDADGDHLLTQAEIDAGHARMLDRK
jgi:hypothetical protein